MSRLIGAILIGMAIFLLLGIALGTRFPFRLSRNATQSSPATTETITASPTATNQSARQAPANATNRGSQSSQQQFNNPTVSQRPTTGRTGTTSPNAATTTTEGIYDPATERTFYYDTNTGLFYDPATGRLYNYDPNTGTFTASSTNRPVVGGW